ncbi:MAG: hypothetical protein ACXWQO_13235 [Bdellovibrionota bacterium]
MKLLLLAALFFSAIPVAGAEYSHPTFSMTGVGNSEDYAWNEASAIAKAQAKNYANKKCGSPAHRDSDFSCVRLPRYFYSVGCEAKFACAIE